MLGLHGTRPLRARERSAFDATGLRAADGARPRRAARSRSGCALPNAFVLGSLAVAIPLTAAEINLSAMPQLASNVGQCLLGCALGARFHPDFLRGAPRFVAAVALSVLAAIGVSAAFAVLVAWVVRAQSGDARARHGARRHRRDVHHGEGAAARRAARHRVSRGALVVLLLVTGPLFAARAAGARGGRRVAASAE